MKRVLVKIEYKGTNYHGWQKQDNAVCVQEIVESALSKLLGEIVCLSASGRTDAGVHATGQYAHFDTCSNFDFSKLPLAINHSLPQDIMIKSAKVVEGDFHARFSAKKKIYKYYVLNSKVRRPIFDDFCIQVPQEICLKTMKKASKHLIGTHNFTSFCAKREYDDRFDNVRTIYSIKIKKIGDFIEFSFCGNGFLYNMVRIIVGTLIEVGKGKINPDELKNIILAKDRTKAGFTAEAKGLFLFDVIY